MDQRAKDEIRKNLVNAYLQELYEEGNKPTDRLKEFVESKAEEILCKFEKSLIIHEIKQIIVNDCRKELLKNSRYGRFIEASLFIQAIIIAILLACIPFFMEVSYGIKWILGGAFTLSLFQIGLNVVLKFRE